MSTTLDSYAPYDAGAGSNALEATWRAMMRRVLATGVLAGVDNNFEVYGDSTGLQVKVKTGQCWIAGHWGQSTSEKILAVATNALGITRGDRVILRNDFVANRIELDILTGTTGTPPTLTQDSSKWEISLATLSVPNGDVSIDAAQVTDARTWTETAGGGPLSVSDVQNTSGTTTSGAFTSTLTGGTACGVAFTAPASGCVLICNNAEMVNSGAFFSLCCVQVRTGSTVGSGTVVLAAANEESIYLSSQGRCGSTRRLAGLTPGASYNAQQMFVVGGATGTYANKSLIVVPA